ncbi:uncharacterized protein V6R79_006508 [Siganus canaliculatus]
MERRKRKKPEQDARECILSGTDKSFIEERYINAVKGKGVFALQHIEPSTFVVEYRGILCQSKNVEDNPGNYLFDFTWNGTHYSIDASKEDRTLGRLVNDDHKKPNCKIKIIVVEGRPHLCLFSVRHICPDEEITYNYGDSSWPWRSVEMCEEMLVPVKDHGKNPSSPTHEEEMCEKLLVPVKNHGENPSTSTHEEEMCEEMLVPVKDHGENPSTPIHEEEMCEEMLVPVKDHGENPSTPIHEEEMCEKLLVPVKNHGQNPSTSTHEECRHNLTSAAVSSLDNCDDCKEPPSNQKWLGYTCKLCSRSWHRFCFKEKYLKLPVVEFSSSDQSSDEDYVLPAIGADEELSSDDFVPESDHDEDDDSDASLSVSPFKPPLKNVSAVTTSIKKPKGVAREREIVGQRPNIQGFSCDLPPSEDVGTSMNSSQNPEANSNNKSCTNKNYCYVCKKPQTKISRHFKKHERTEPDIAAAFVLPKHSKDRKMLLEKLRNRGNYEHNQDAMNNNSQPLKLKRRPGRVNVQLNAKGYVHCVYCRGMFLRKELWRHTRRCPQKTVSVCETAGRAQVLALADTADLTYCPAISPGVWKILSNMKDDDVSSVVRNDFLLLQLAQSLYNKHGSDPTKSEYIRQKVREMGRLLLTLRTNSALFSFEDAVRPNNFYKIVEAVKCLSGYDEESHSCKIPSLALKLGHSLNKIADIILCRAIAAEDDTLTKAIERFKKLYTSEWAERVSHGALASLNKSKFNKPSTLPFAKDVQLLHKYLEKKSAEAFDKLKNEESPQTYTDLARVTLAQLIVFNRRRAGEVSKMTLDCFMSRDQTELHGDIAAGLSLFEQQMSKHFSRVEIMGKRGRKVAVLLNPDHVSAIKLLVDKREACGVPMENPFLFGRPKCSATSFYRGQDCIRVFANQCGAQNPENLRSTQLRKHMATMSQILNLKDNELDQLANFLGHDIRVHRDYYRLPDATIEIAKISKLLLAMEKGTLTDYKGKSLDEIELEAELDPDPELDLEESENEEPDAAPEERGQDETSPGEAEITAEGPGTSFQEPEQRHTTQDATVTSAGQINIRTHAEDKNIKGEHCEHQYCGVYFWGLFLVRMIMRNNVKIKVIPVTAVYGSWTACIH